MLPYSLFFSWRQYSTEERIKTMEPMRKMMEGDDLKQLIEQTEIGGMILLYEGKWHEWGAHPQGVVVRQGSKFLLNGKDLLCEGKFENWEAHPRGLIAQQGNRLLLNGKELLYEGEFDEWYPHASGVVIRQKDRFLLNGAELLEQERPGWHNHRRGMVIIRHANRPLFIGKKLSYNGQCDGCCHHLHGMVINQSGKFILIVYRD